MITGHLNDVLIDLPESFEWEIIRESQLLSFDKLVDFAVPKITFPPTENNQAVFNHPTRFTLIRKKVRRYDGFELRSEGLSIFRGTLILKEGFSGSVYGTAGKIAELNQDKKITNYTFPIVEFRNKAEYTIVDGYAPARILNPMFFSGVSKSETFTDENDKEYDETILQRKHKNVSYAVNLRNLPDGVKINNEPLTFSLRSSEDYQLTVVSPFLYIFPLIESLLRQNGLYLRNNELSNDPDLMSLILYNNVDINTGDAGTTYIRVGKTMKNDSIWVVWSGYVASVTRGISTFDYSKLIPEVSIKDLIIGIQNLLNIAIMPNGDDTFSIIDREARLLGTPQNIDNFFNGVWELGEKKDSSLKFVMLHDDSDAMFGETYVDLSDRIEDFGEDITEPDGETLLMSINGAFLGELRRVTAVHKIFEWSSTVITDEDNVGLEKQVFAWIFISVDYQPGFVNYSKEKEVETIETSFSTLCGKGEIPFTQQPGRTNLRKATEAPFSLRALFYTNELTCSNHTENYSLKMTGENNLIETRYKYFAPWWASRQSAIGYASLPDNFLKNFDINRKVSTREGQVMPMRTVTKIHHWGIGETKIEGFKVE